MERFTFPGTYEDDRGIEALHWEVRASDRPGYRGRYEIHTTVRGVNIWGTDFDGLEPDEPGAADLHTLALSATSGELIDCVLTGDLPCQIEVDGTRVTTPVHFEFDFRTGSGVLRDMPVLRLLPRGARAHGDELPPRRQSSVPSRQIKGRLLARAGHRGCTGDLHLRPIRTPNPRHRIPRLTASAPSTHSEPAPNLDARKHPTPLRIGLIPASLVTLTSAPANCASYVTDTNSQTHGSKCSSRSNVGPSHNI